METFGATVTNNLSSYTPAHRIKVSFDVIVIRNFRSINDEK
jgi:hypothetical protein